jgi:hypothetical protein
MDRQKFVKAVAVFLAVLMGLSSAAALFQIFM